MADSAKVRTGLPALIQDHLSPKLVNNVSNVMPLVYALLGLDGNKKDIYGLGRYKTGVVISGVPMTPVRREKILNSDTYMPAVVTSLPGDHKGMGQRDTLPQRTNWTINHPASRIKRPAFKWFEMASPLSVPNKDIRRTRQTAPNEAAAYKAIGDLWRLESDLVEQSHTQEWNKRFWGTTGTGAPTDQSAEVWDNIFSVKEALKEDNIYGGVDRTLAANAFWKGHFISAERAINLEDLINEADYNLGCRKKGRGIGLVLCGGTLFPKFKAEARLKGGTIFHDGMPKMGEFGFRREVVRFNDTFVIYDPECPDVLHESGSYSTNAAAFINLDTWTIAISPDANFSVDDPFDQSKVKGGTDETTSNMRTEMMFVCEAPSLNVWFDNIK
jgi:hypothetical protein